MDIITLAIVVIVILAIIAIVYYFVRESGIPIPQPVRIVLLAALCIIAIIILANLAGVGRPLFRFGN